MNENEINIKFEKLFKKCELLEEDNKNYKIRLQRNDETIINLNQQIKNLRKILEINFDELKKYYAHQFQLLLDAIAKKKENSQENNKLFIQENQNDLKDIKKMYEDIANITDKKLKEVKDKINEEIKERPNIVKDIREIEEEKKVKEKNDYKEVEIIEYKGRTLFELLENKLIKIFLENDKDIDIKDINELKKISMSLIIRGRIPSEEIKEFIEKNINNNINELNDKQKVNLANKKTIIYMEIEKISLNKIETNNYAVFIEKFREKYGITEEDINKTDLIKEISKYKFDEIGIIKEILKKLKYLKEYE